MTQIIRVIDLETCGTEPDETGTGVCEVGFCDLISKTTDLVGAPVWWEVDGGDWMLVDPGCPIPPEASAVHHLIDEDVRGARPWDVAWPMVRTSVNGPIRAFAAHSAKFERSFIPGSEQLAWICTYKAALRLWPEAPLHSNQGLRYWRRPEGLDRSIATPAHRAFPDAYTTAHLLRDMLNDGATVEQLIEWADQPALQVTCRIGDWRGHPWTEVDDGFLHWILRKDFDEDVVFTVRTELERRAREAQQQGDLLT